MMIKMMEEMIITMRVAVVVAVAAVMIIMMDMKIVIANN